ncbi:unnamed protein product [Miscanthus lutarioriparius]|uniref:Uncharacterized protein n=1 Tax=Miscanthus lutarioriparius TaxID=422564 RepID=A0A811S4E8_9POAL|nr:unnamed protein product [Miscanthus lutarioriparius]
MGGWSKENAEQTLSLWRDTLPLGHCIPDTIKKAQKIIRDLGLTYIKIDACVNDCMLFRGPLADMDTCPTCGESRWKKDDTNSDEIGESSESGGAKKRTLCKVLRYFPLTPRLQRLYMSKETSSLMRWHKEELVSDGKMRHPADSLAWKHVNDRYKWFDSDPQKNICESLLGTLLELQGKCKDSEKARLDMQHLGIRPDQHLVLKKGKYTLPPALYSLGKDDKEIMCKFLHGVKFPDGYAANIRRCVDVNGCKLSGLKTHDLHSTLQNNASTQVAPIIEEEDETGGHENENEDGLQETQPGSVVTVQKGLPAPTRSTRSTAPSSRTLFNENTTNVTASKRYITSQQLMNRTRNNPKRRKEM